MQNTITGIIDAVRAVDAVRRAVREKIPQELSKQFVYNPETKTPFPQSPYHDIARASSLPVGSPDRMKAEQDIAMNMVMGINTPMKAVNSKVPAVVTKGSLYDITKDKYSALETRIKSKAIGRVNPDINRATDAGFITRDGDFVSVDTGHSKALGDLGMGEKTLNDYLDAGGIRTFISRETGDVNVQINKAPTPQQMDILMKLPEGRRYFFDVKSIHPNYTKVGTTKADFMDMLNKTFNVAQPPTIGKRLSKFANEEVDIDKLNEKYLGETLKGKPLYGQKKLLRDVPQPPISDLSTKRK